HRHPAITGLQVELAVLEVVLVELAAVVAAVIPGRAVEGERLGAGIAAFDHLRLAHQLAVDLALPGLAALVADLVAHFDGVGATLEDEAAADLHAVGTLPDEGHDDLILALGQGVLALG